VSLQHGLGLGVLQFLLGGQPFQRAKPPVLLDRYHDGGFAAEVDHLIQIFVGVPDRLYAHAHDSRELVAATLATPLSTKQSSPSHGSCFGRLEDVRPCATRQQARREQRRPP
jgi:hypothetical protein